MMPETVQVGPHRYQVVATTEAVMEARNNAGNAGLVGHHDAMRCRLTVDPDIPPSQAADTLLHEVLHAVLMVTGADEQLARRKAGLDEYVICALTPTLLDVLQRNPDLVAFLVDPDHYGTRRDRQGRGRVARQPASGRVGHDDPEAA